MTDYIYPDIETAAAKAEQESSWKSCIVDLTKEIAKPTPVLRDPRDNSSLWATEGNLIMVAGEAKARKTFNVKMLVYIYLQQNAEGSCIWVDTEQSEYHIGLAFKAIQEVMNWEPRKNHPRLTMVSFLGLPKKERLNMLKEMMSEVNPGLLVIDNIGHLVTNINDPEQSDTLVTMFDKFKKENPHSVILGVLHTNEGSSKLSTDPKMRGHVGSDMEQYAETIFKVTRVDSKVSKVAIKSRNALAQESYQFFVDDHWIPRIMEHAADGDVEPLPKMTATEQKQADCFKHLPVEGHRRAFWWQAVMKSHGAPQSSQSLKAWFEKAIALGWLLEDKGITQTEPSYSHKDYKDPQRKINELGEDVSDPF